MKVDRINQSQIRFMLCRKDLEERDLNVKELAYGSEKTKALFDDMMAEARREFNFNEQGQPLMIEAIPLSDDQLMITVTLVNGAAEKLGLSAGNVPGLGPEGAKGAAAPADGKAAELEELLKELKVTTDPLTLAREGKWTWDAFLSLLDELTAALKNLKMTVRSSGYAGTSDGTDTLSARNGASVGNGDGSKMPV